MEPIEETRTWAEGRARELVATRLARGGACGDHPSADRWRSLLEETLATSDAARMASLVSELADLGADGVEAREWLPRRPQSPGSQVGTLLAHDHEPAPPTPTPAGDQTRRRPQRLSRNGLFGAARTAAIAIIVGLVVKALLVQVFFVPSSSMAPTLNPGERVAVDKLLYRLDGIDRGDVIVFDAPDGQAHDTLVKRVVATGGDEVAASGGHLTLNGETVEEPYLPDGTVTLDFGPVAVPNGHLFVLGDNRMDSLDSRMFGAIPSDAVIGRPLLRVWPPSNIGPL